jgi:hypothetical protein
MPGALERAVKDIRLVQHVSAHACIGPEALLAP